MFVGPSKLVQQQDCYHSSFSRVTTDFSNYKEKGNFVTAKMPVIVGNSGKTYALIPRKLVMLSTLQVNFMPPCLLRALKTFFRDSQHFGFGK